MVDIIIDRAVLESMSALAGQYKSKFLTRLVNANIDIANIRSFVRIKRIGKDLRFLKEVLADGGSIAVPRYLELFPKTFDDFFEMLDGTPYGPALSDAYDAITSDRPYCKGRSPEVAARILREEAGKQFHPQVAVVAAAMIEDGRLAPPSAGTKQEELPC